MDDIINRLTHEFFFSLNTETKKTGSLILTVTSDWKAKTPGVDYVYMYITGIDPLTGEPLDEDRYSYRFDSVQTKYDSGILGLYGTYHIHFDACLQNMKYIKDFIYPYEITLNSPKGKPYIFWSQIKAPIGWTGVQFESNCWRRCNGKLWAKYTDGHYQQLPDFLESTMKCYIPLSKWNPEFFRTDHSLPEPEKRN